MDVEKLNRWAKVIHDNATSHGWHEEKHSPEHWLSLIMCEVAEAIEADRKGGYADTDKMKKEMDKIRAANVYYPNTNFCSAAFSANYNSYIKSSVEEEFADIVIRLLDVSVELYGEFEYLTSYRKIVPSKKMNLAENLWFFVKNILYYYQPQISESIFFIYDLAEQLDIDLDQHIEWKMKYNESRPYKHGGKKY